MLKIIPLLLLLLFSACAPIEPLDPQTTPPPGDTTTDNNETPNLSWNPENDTIILSGTICCGLTTVEYVRNYIPDFQLKSNGTLIWTNQLADSGREVLQAKISQEKINEILTELKQKGFFTWEDRYANENVTDLPDQCIRITLLNIEKSVCEYFGGAPPEFHELYDFLSTGAGETGRPFIPENGYLQTTALDVDQVNALIKWNNESIQLSSLQSEGTWISGDALLELWTALNQSPFAPIAQENGVFYVFTIQIEGISFRPPPAQ